MQRREFLATGASLALPHAGSAAAPATTPPAPSAAVAPHKWRANWIWTYPNPGLTHKTVNQQQARNSWFYARRSFELAGKPERARVRVCADSRYTLYVNGQRIGFGPARSDPRRQSYDIYSDEILKHLKPGANVIAAVVHHVGQGTFAYIPGRAAFLLEGEITAGGTRVELQTDSSWKLLPGLPWQPVPHRLSLQTDFPEIYDARLEPVGWNSTGYDDAWWNTPVLIGVPPVGPWGEMVPRDIPFFGERDIAPVAVVERGESVPMQREFIIDTYEVFGRPELLRRDKKVMRAEVTFDIEGSGEARLVAGYSNPYEVLVNGTKVFEVKSGLGGGSGHTVRYALPPVALKPGANRVEIRIPLNPTIQYLYVGHTGPAGVLRYSGWLGRGGVREKASRFSPRASSQIEIAAIQQTEQLVRATSSGDALARVEPSPRDQYVLLDFGKEVFGYPQLKIRSAGRGIIDLGYCEHLENGRAIPNEAGVNNADRYILRRGAQQWQTFEKRAFRYMQVDFRGLTAPVQIESVGVRFSTYPVEYRGTFACPEERLNRIWEGGRYTVQLNMDDAYTDCPWRERAMWMGDARVEGLVGYYAFGDVKLLARTLRLIGESQDGEGITRGLYPSGIDFRLPSFTLLWVVTIWDYYMHSGDLAFVQELYPKVRNALAFFERKANTGGLLEDLQKNYWVFIDWTPLDNRGEATAINCFWAGATQAAARMAEALGRTADAARYRKVAEGIKKALRTRLWLPDRGVFADCRTPAGLSAKISQPSNALAVIFGVVPEGAARQTMEYVLNPANQVIPVGSPYFSFYLTQAMYTVGMHERALAYIREKWNAMLDAGATTWWEEWNGKSSWCHGWSAGPTYDLMAEFAGLKPAAPGFRKLAVCPHPGGLEAASTSIAVPGGMASLEWKSAPQRFQAGLNAPAGLPLAISLPRAGAGKVTVDGKPVAARTAGDRVTFEWVSAGRHSIVVA